VGFDRSKKTGGVGNAPGARNASAPGKRTLTEAIPAPPVSGTATTGGASKPSNGTPLPDQIQAKKKGAQGGTQGAIHAKDELPFILELQVESILSMQGDGEIAKSRAMMLQATLRTYQREHREILLKRFGQPTLDDNLAQQFLKLPKQERTDTFAILIDQGPPRTEKLPAGKKDGPSRFRVTENC
jgi:hypothetical protein